MLLTEFKAKDKAAMLRCGGLAEGDITDGFGGGLGDIADDCEGELGDAVAELLCLDPRTPPSTAAKISANPTTPTYSIHFLFLLEG